MQLLSEIAPVIKQCVINGLLKPLEARELLVQGAALTGCTMFPPFTCGILYVIGVAGIKVMHIGSEFFTHVKNQEKKLEKATASLLTSLNDIRKLEEKNFENLIAFKKSLKESYKVIATAQATLVNAQATVENQVDITIQALKENETLAKFIENRVKAQQEQYNTLQSACARIQAIPTETAVQIFETSVGKVVAFYQENNSTVPGVVTSTNA